jgi:hypothetical protein
VIFKSTIFRDCILHETDSKQIFKLTTHCELLGEQPEVSDPS